MNRTEADVARYRAVQELFTLALDQPERERVSFVAERCGGDYSLCEEVLSLLAADADAADYLDVPAAALPLAAGGNQVGPYRLLRTLGEGGTSIVYMARRSDGRLRQRVALKLVKPGLASSQILRRFHQEQHILAALNHSNIARLLDGGESADGRPYFVLEYVEGEPIDTHCEQHNLPLPERLKLFATVCRAVHYAHQNLVVHRDLKPDNIVVTATGVPKLLDFGIAKLLNPELYDLTFDATTVNLRPMTPRYASPEQAAGRRITTASDIYSLGVLLYVLLSGRHPYELNASSVEDMVRVICEQDPPPPSSVIGSRERKTRGLTRELDTIVRMAMHKEPARRYASALEFGIDIERFLAGFPITARGDRLMYRVRKLAQRHRAAVATTGLAFLIFVGGAVGVVWQGRKAIVAQARAELQRQRIEESSVFLVDLLTTAGLGESERIRAAGRALLDRGAARARADTRIRPEVRAALMHSLGVGYLNAGNPAEAADLLADVLVLRRRVLERDDPDLAVTMLALGRARERLGDTQVAEALYLESLHLRETVLGEEHPLVAENLLALAQLETRRDSRGAEALFRRALAIRTRHFGSDHWQVAEVEGGLGIWLCAHGRYNEAERLVRRALATRALATGSDDLDVAWRLNDLGLVLLAQGDYDEAERVFQRAHRIARRALGEQHPEVVALGNSIATIWSEQGRLREAERWYRELVPGERELRDVYRPVRDNDLYGLASVLLLQGRAAEALPLAERVLAMRRAVHGNDHRSISESLALLARIQLATGQAAAAEGTIREAIALWERLITSGHPTHAVFRSLLASTLRVQGKNDQAAELLNSALADARASLRPGNPIIGDILIELGLVRAAQGQVQAIEVLQQALDLRRAAFGPSHWRTAQAQSLLGASILANGDRVLGQRLLREGLAGLQAALGETHPETALARVRLSAVSPPNHPESIPVP